MMAMSIIRVGVTWQYPSSEKRLSVSGGNISITKQCRQSAIQHDVLLVVLLEAHFNYEEDLSGYYYYGLCLLLCIRGLYRCCRRHYAST